MSTATGYAGSRPGSRPGDNGQSSSGGQALSIMMPQMQPGFGQPGRGTGVQQHVVTRQVEAIRRPKMCPYHSELVEYSLALGDPGQALGAFSQHAFSIMQISFQHSRFRLVHERACQVMPMPW